MGVKEKTKKSKVRQQQKISEGVQKAAGRINVSSLKQKRGRL